MKLVQNARELSDALIASKGPVHFVPTMGYLHDGHASLIRLGKCTRDEDDRDGVVVVSIFVNKLQFNDLTDFEQYPTDLSRDELIAAQSGCDILFVPKHEEIYPANYRGSIVRVPGLSELWEGEFRPGHFDGVATVVCKLFHLVLPDFAYFGEKDWQQCRVVEQMVEDLSFPVWIRTGDTVREPDGLAMSSRNARLRPEVRPRAATLFEMLTQCADRFANGLPPRIAEQSASHQLLAAGFESVDYIAIVDAKSLQPLDAPEGDARVIGAGTIGGVRLIDNVRVAKSQ